MATKKDIREIHEILDTLLKLSLKRDQEMTSFSHGAIRRDSRIEILEKDMSIIKPLVSVR